MKEDGNDKKKFKNGTTDEQRNGKKEATNKQTQVRMNGRIIRRMDRGSSESRDGGFHGPTAKWKNSRMNGGTTVTFPSVLPAFHKYHDAANLPYLPIPFAGTVHERLNNRRSPVCKAAVICSII